MSLVGQRLGQYQIEAEIGHGGMATIYRATQTSIERMVAIKVLPSRFLQDRTFLARFTREVQVVARLQHMHILPVYDFGEQDGTPYIVMAYMEGGTLEDYIRQGPLLLDDVVRIVGQIASGVDFAHSKGVIHRDVKPSNVLMDEQGNCFLTDFGIAKVVSGPTVELTGSGMMVGAPAYMAPEMYGSGEMVPAVDIYALGVTLYKMLTGSVPFEAEMPMQLMLLHINEQVPDVRELRADLPTEVQVVIERAMAKAPSDRFSSAGALAQALALVAAGKPADAPPTVLPVGQDVATRRKRRVGKPRLRWTLLGGAALGAALLTGILALTGLLKTAQAPTSPAMVATPAVQIDSDEAAPTKSQTAESAASEASTSMPSDTPIPVTTPGTLAFASFAELRTALLDALTSRRDYSVLQSLMGDAFVISIWESESIELAPLEAIEQLRLNYLPPDAFISYRLDAALTTMLGGINPLSLWDADVNTVNAIYSEGWGADGNGEVILIIAQREDDSYYWYSMLFAGNGF